MTAAGAVGVALVLALLAGGVPLAVAAAGNASVRGRIAAGVAAARPADMMVHHADRAIAPWTAGLDRVVGPLTAHRDQRRRAEALSEVLTTLGQQLRSGHSLTQAVETAARTAPAALAGELDGVVYRSRHGAGLLEGLRWWMTLRADDDDIHMAAASLAAAVETGGPAARAVDVASEIVRDRRALAGDLAALTAQARVSAVVIGLAPVAMAALTALTDPATVGFLLTSGPGLAMLVGGLTLDGLGVVWMVAMMRRRR